MGTVSGYILENNNIILCQSKNIVLMKELNLIDNNELYNNINIKIKEKVSELYNQIIQELEKLLTKNNDLKSVLLELIKENHFIVNIDSLIKKIKLKLNNIFIDLEKKLKGTKKKTDNRNFRE